MPYMLKKRAARRRAAARRAILATKERRAYGIALKVILLILSATLLISLLI